MARGPMKALREHVWLRDQKRCALQFAGCEGREPMRPFHVHHRMYQRNGGAILDARLNLLGYGTNLHMRRIATLAVHLCVACEACHTIQHELDHPDGMIPGRVGELADGTAIYMGPDREFRALWQMIEEIIADLDLRPEFEGPLKEARSGWGDLLLRQREGA